ncbi:derlin-1.1-like isoform X3 [Typha latifolia]|uniref:derlin-1.1-like isoform X3 n=1 Tax=Typha latifolia TaxID=4733 RepID=UPI003C2C8436
MSSPAEYYRSLPPVSRAYGVLCLMTTTAYYFQLYDVEYIWLSYDLVLKRFQLWRLFTNFFFLAPFSTYFGIRFLMLARYGVLLENGSFKRRTGDFLWMIIFGALSIMGIYLPWAMLALDIIFNNPLKPDIMGVLAGHLYYFFAVLYPLSGGKNILKTPLWVHKLVAFWGEGAQMNSPVQQNPHAGVAFRGASYRLNR